MSLYQAKAFLPRWFGLVLSSFLQRDGLPFSEVLPEEQIHRAFEEEGCLAGGEDRVYTPAVTLWAFLSQVLHKGGKRGQVRYWQGGQSTILSIFP